MPIYRCLADLQGRTPEYGDTVILKDIKYFVMSRYLKEFFGNNEKIFCILEIPSKIKFTTSAYGYECSGGGWPECKKDDYPALTRCVIELYKIIEGKTLTSEKEQWYKITSPGKTGISPKQVQELIIKYGGLINYALSYDGLEGSYVWAKNKKVNYYSRNVREDAIELSLTTEITTTKKEEKYETQFQRKKAHIERGTRPEGSTVCGRRSKASVAVGHLGYRKVTGI